MDMEHALSVFAEGLRNTRASERTVEAYVGVVRRVHKEYGDLLDTPQRAQARLQLWHETRRQDYNNERISASKIRVELAALRAFYRYLIGEGMYPENPAQGFKPVGSDPWMPRPMPMPEVGRLLQAIQSIEDRAMVGLFLNGLRNVEVCRLQTDWIRYDETEQTLVLRIVGKGRRLGEVPLSPDTAALLGSHLLQTFAEEERERWVTECGGVVQACDRLLRRKLKDQRKPVFTWQGRPLTRRRVNKIFAVYREQAGLDESYGPHSLRHTTATELLEAGTDIRVVQEIMRHSSIAMTQRYTQVRTGPKAQAMRKLALPVG